MTEWAEQLLSNGYEAASEEVRFSYSRPEQPWLNRETIRVIERLSGQRHLERLYREWARRPVPGENIFAAAMRLMKIEIDVDSAAMSRVPRSGPVLFVANHPFGVIDGLAVGHLTTTVRPDTKIMTHSLLCQAPEAREYLLPVDFGGTPEAQQTSLLTRRRTMDWLAAGHAVAVFPAGGVSTAQHPFSGPALDSPWHPFVGKLARMPGVTTVPLFFHGQNSRLFQLMSHVHYALRIALLFRETVRRIGKPLKISVGEPIRSGELSGLATRDDIVRTLRQRTLSLAGPNGPDPDLAFRWPSHIGFD